MIILKDPIQYPIIEEFFDAIENKHTIKIKTEANKFFPPNTVSITIANAGSLTRALHIAREKYIDAMARTDVLLGAPNPWADDLITLIRAIKQMGMYEEAEGLPRKYDECLNKYNIQLKEYQELKKDFDVVSENYEKLKTEKEELENKVNTLNLELDAIRRR